MHANVLVGRRMRALALVVVVGGCGLQPTVGRDAVPPSYSSLYSSLDRSLDAYERAVDAMPVQPDGGAAPTLATELLPANGNRLRELLLPTTLPAVDLWLDRLAGLGFGGVTIGIKVPMLLSDFGADAAAYTAFFASVADRARLRGMTVDVELGALFCGTVYAACASSHVDGYDDLVEMTIAQARIVIDRVRPDLLTILAEPTTEAALAGADQLLTERGVASFVRTVLAGIGARGTTRVGAGAATWLPASYNAAILETPVDYLALHIYPISDQIVATLVQDTELARAAGVPIVADEVGLYKASDRDASTPATADRVFRLDAFSFFQPLDVRFADITARWAQKAGVAYVSPFWAGQLFTYVQWTPVLDVASHDALTRELNRAVRDAFEAGELSDLGRAWLRRR